MRKRAGWLAKISLARSEIIGRRDENSSYEHACPVTDMKRNVLIGCQSVPYYAQTIHEHFFDHR